MKIITFVSIESAMSYQVFLIDYVAHDLALYSVLCFSGKQPMTDWRTECELKELVKKFFLRRTVYVPTYEF